MKQLIGSLEMDNCWEISDVDTKKRKKKKRKLIERLAEYDAPNLIPLSEITDIPLYDDAFHVDLPESSSQANKIPTILQNSLCEIQNSPDINDINDIHKITKANETAKTPEPDSLFQYSLFLQQKVDLLNIDGKLFYYNGKCYLPLTSTKLSQLYRQKVDTVPNRCITCKASTISY